MNDNRPLSGFGKRWARRVVPVALTLACCVVAALPAANRAAAQTGPLHILTQADNGVTLTVAVGDSIELRLQPEAGWTVSLSNPGILRRPPIALVRGVQGFWNVIGQGQTTITATGIPPCQSIVCPDFALGFSATIIVGGNPPPPPGGGSVTYPPGWNIVGVPTGTVLPVDAFTWEPDAFRYARVPSGTPLRAGRGYWAFFTAPQTVPLAATTETQSLVQAPANEWVLVGNPSGVGAAAIAGADLVYVYNPASGVYIATQTAAPGAGAWALSFRGSVVVISAPPLPPSAEPAQ